MKGPKPTPTMNVITVIPLTRSKIGNELSYFTSSSVPVGAIVSVPLRSKYIDAIVTSVIAASEMKSELKSSTYTLKKLERVKATAFFPAAFIEACKTLSDYYACSIGAVIDTLVTDTIVDHAHKISLPLTRDSLHTSPGVGSNERVLTLDDTYAIQGNDEDRFGSWRSLIRQEFARRRSIVFYTPTIEDARVLSEALTKGIEGYMFTLHSKLTKKTILETWKSIASTTHPVVIVATGSFALFPRSDIDTIIIERENGRGWISQKYPYLDLRHALETIAHLHRQTVYRADSMLRSETLRRLDSQNISPGSPFKWRSISTATDSLIDMKKSVVPDSPAPFRVLSPELIELISRNREENSHLFILTTRRGMSPITVCSDCETIVLCTHCSSPVVVHISKGSGMNFFMCHHCGERRSAEEVCLKCGSWRLTPLGIGIERVEQEIQQIFPGLDLFKIDVDTTKTGAQITQVMEKFRSRPGSILLGTELALPHLGTHMEHIAVVSLDSLLALPDFRIQEKIMYTLVRLRALASRSILVQTRRIEEKVFEYGLKGNLSDFYRGVLEERKRFEYPPFSNLIKITIEGTKDTIATAMADVRHRLEPHDIDVFPAFTATVKGNSIIHGLIKIPEGGWPNSDLVARLRNLPPNVKVKIDPESLL